MRFIANSDYELNVLFKP